MRHTTKESPSKKTPRASHIARDSAGACGLPVTLPSLSRKDHMYGPTPRMPNRRAMPNFNAEERASSNHTWYKSLPSTTKLKYGDCVEASQRTGVVTLQSLPANMPGQMPRSSRSMMLMNGVGKPAASLQFTSRQGFSLTPQYSSLAPEFKHGYMKPFHGVPRMSLSGVTPSCRNRSSPRSTRAYGEFAEAMQRSKIWDRMA
mmetsp:Transcript_93425/g.269030  ORF Transcript_93425/g.269030 Transcript_93425/m.269030 type:complete len:202 (-) Transcript_93425:696-1301(-)